MAWGSVRPVAIQKRSAESASALRTLAEDLRIKTTNVNTEYCSSVYANLPQQSTNSTLTCKLNYDTYKQDTSLPSSTHIADNQIVNRTTLLYLLNDTMQMNHTLTSTQTVVQQSLVLRGCLPGETDYCLLICSPEKKPEQVLVCSLTDVLRKAASLILKLQQETNCLDCIQSKYVDIDITPVNDPSTIQLYNVLVMQYAQQQTEAASKATNLYQG